MVKLLVLNWMTLSCGHTVFWRWWQPTKLLEKNASSVTNMTLLSDRRDEQQGFLSIAEHYGLSHWEMLHMQSLHSWAENCSAIYISISVLDWHIEAETKWTHFPDDNFKSIFLNESVTISIKISLKFVPWGPINKNPALVQIMAWHRPCDKPLSKPMMVRLLTHICVTRPKWVKVLSLSYCMGLDT